jgi:gas vesicle protein
MSDQRTDSLLAFLLGAAVGAGVALLLAPASGEETRKKLTETARRVGDDVGHRLAAAKDDLKHQADDVKAAVGAGREAYQRARTSGEPAPTSSAM